MKSAGDHINLYFDLYWNFKSQIILKELPAGSRIPTIEDLHKQYQVSHGTVRRAMELLENEGLISRKAGLGTFVREDVDLPMWVYDKSIEEIYSVLRNLRIEPICDGWVESPARIQAIFREYKDAHCAPMVYRIKRLTISNRDNRKRMITEIFAPGWVVEGIDFEKLRYSPVYETVAELKGFKAAHAHEIIRPWICDKANGELLGVVAGMPLFHRTSIATDPENRILFIRETLTTANILVMESDLE